MASRRRQRGNELSIDSLLDTMANVVGILIVLVAVTQLSVGDAVERLRGAAGERAAATPADFAEVVGEREAVEADLEQIRGALTKYSVSERSGLMWADAEDLLDELEALPGESDSAGDRPSDADLENRRIEVERLEGEVAESRGEHEQLLAFLKEPKRANTPRLIRLPDPRPPPLGLDREFFFCRGGRVYVVDFPYLEGVLVRGIAEAVGSPNKTIVLEIEDFSWIVNHFAKQSVGANGFRWRFDSADPNRFLARVEWTEQVVPGETEAELERGGSRFAAEIERLDPSREYVRFFVWPDSFDVYLAARRIAEERGLRVGWAELDLKDDLNFNVMKTQRRGRVLLD